MRVLLLWDTEAKLPRGKRMSYIQTVRNFGAMSPYWLVLWDSLMADDLENFNNTLDYAGWNAGYDLYTLLIRFKKNDCLVVYVTKVPLWFLKEQYFGCLSGRRYIRDEAYRRKYIKLLLDKWLGVSDLVTYIWTYIIPSL